MYKNISPTGSGIDLRILHICSRLNASSFGIGASALGLARSQQDAGVLVNIWTLDSKEQQLALEQTNKLAPNSMQCFSNYGPRRLGFSPTMEREIRNRRQQFDILHQHEIWTLNSRVTNAWRQSCAKPTVVTVHGALELQARHRSSWKKRLALIAYESTNLTSTSCFHALSAREAQSIRTSGLSAPIAVIPNGVHSCLFTSSGQPDSFRKKHGLPRDVRIMLFLGRISPIKGLPMLIDALAALRPYMKDWLLVIAGVDQFGHEALLKAQVEKLDLHRFVRFVGPQFDQAKLDALAASDLFVLPSYSEASPMSVLESMAMGVPVLTTKAASWEELNRRQCGWCTEISQAEIANALADALSKSVCEMNRKGAACKALVASQYSWEHIAVYTIQLYNWLLYGGAAPDFIYQG